MKILALETTERVGTVAAADQTGLLAQVQPDPALRSAQSLIPAIADLLEQVGWEPTDVDLVAVTTGPGSFTGLRLGVTTAKTFAYAVDAEILGIDTLEAIAAALPDDVDRLAVAVDAQRGQLAATVFRRGPGGDFAAQHPMRLVDIDDWLTSLPEGTAIAGPVLAKLKDRLPSTLRPVSSDLWHPTAATVASLAARDHATGRRDDLWQLVPRYSRRSAAEEKIDK